MKAGEKHHDHSRGNLILRLPPTQGWGKVRARLGQGWGKVLGKVRARSAQGWGKVWTKSKVRARSRQARSEQGSGKVRAREAGDRLRGVIRVKYIGIAASLPRPCFLSGPCPNLAPTLPQPCPNLTQTLPTQTLPQPCFFCPDLARTLPKTLSQPCPNLT